VERSGNILVGVSLSLLKSMTEDHLLLVDRELEVGGTGASEVARDTWDSKSVWDRVCEVALDVARDWDQEREIEVAREEAREGSLDVALEERWESITWLSPYLWLI